MNLRLTILSCLLLFQSSATNAQGTPTFKGPVVYIAAGGSSLRGFTLNVEHVLCQTKNRFVFLMTGFATYPSLHVRYLSIPMGLNFMSRVGNHHGELGFALTYNEGTMNNERFNLSSGNYKGNRSLYFIPIAGYRFQRPEGGFFFKIFYCPVFKLHEFDDKRTFGDAGFVSGAGAGLGLGYFFSKNK